jgi:hypothetical protein
MSVPPILHDLITLIILGGGYKLWCSSLCSVLQPPVTSSLYGPNILLSTLILNTHSLCSTHNEPYTVIIKQNFSTCFGFLSPRLVPVCSVFFIELLFVEFAIASSQRAVPHSPLHETPSCWRQCSVTKWAGSTCNTSWCPVRVSAGIRTSLDIGRFLPHRRTTIDH